MEIDRRYEYVAGNTREMADEDGDMPRRRCRMWKKVLTSEGRRGYRICIVSDAFTPRGVH